MKEGFTKAQLKDVETWLTPREVAEVLRVNYLTVIRMLNDGEFPTARRFGGSWRIPKSALAPKEEPKP